jgi:precorrin-2 dehydrogenase/sirohydrochlorin ferrochelatase
MVYVVDNPSMSDFILPAIAKVGEVIIAISTSGKSPAMAKVLRQRVERMITQEDLLQIKLQNHAREILKQRIPEQKDRKKILYKILKDNQVKKLLKEEKFDEAQEVARRIIESHEGQSLQEAQR